MMATLLLAILLQAQEPTLDDRIAAFVKGDAAARAELVKLGVYAIRPLQKARAQSPEKIDALVYELKKAAAHPPCFDAIKALDRSVGIIGDASHHVNWIGNFVQNAGARSFVDVLDVARLKADKFSFRGQRLLREHLDDACSQLGLDWGLFHNHVVIAHPNRLWPSGPQMKVTELDAEGLTRAKALVEKLADDSIEARESASRDLLAMGPAVTKVLEAGLSRKEGEISARCAGLMESLRVNAKGAFGPPGTDRQGLGGDDEKLQDRLRTIKATVSFNRVTMRDIAAHFGKIDSLPIDVDPAVPDTPITLHMTARNIHDILALATQSLNVDFTIQKGRILIAPPAK